VPEVARWGVKEVDATPIDAAILRLHIVDLQAGILGIIADAEEQTLPQIASYGRMGCQLHVSAPRVQAVENQKGKIKKNQGKSRKTKAVVQVWGRGSM